MRLSRAAWDLSIARLTASMEMLDRRWLGGGPANSANKLSLGTKLLRGCLRRGRRSFGDDVDHFSRLEATIILLQLTV
jgi:hypothetical protein